MCCFKILFLILLGFAISSIVIYTKKDPYINENCVPILLPSEFNVNKIITNQWTWTYKINDNLIKHYCPGVNHDVNLFNKKFVAQTKTEANKITILDCQGRPIYYIITDKITQISNTKNLIAYTDNFFSDSINIKDFNNKEILILNKYFFEWNIKILNTSHPISDIRLILLIIGKVSFSENNSTDICNHYFWSVSWSVLALSILILIYLTYKFFKYKPQNDDPYQYYSLQEL